MTDLVTIVADAAMRGFITLADRDNHLDDIRCDMDGALRSIRDAVAVHWDEFMADSKATMESGLSDYWLRTVVQVHASAMAVTAYRAWKSKEYPVYWCGRISPTVDALHGDCTVPDFLEIA